ncbi:MAG: glutamine--fructose-6-phosphate transaminase (isomerizing) [Lachnospiraceae bacterium]|nr:glutamine--fructose-6-phosphate transaminase (isomerizing) [Lachnospiraceae bacterium]
MCGIVGYVGKQQAAEFLLQGLEKLEYRGYDSAGISVRNGDDENVTIVKAKGRLKTLVEKTDGGKTVKGCCGIGHTRWATHGEPSELNAHPHYSDDKNVILVHNGIIENFAELKTKLEKNGYTFYSQTDTEVVTKLIDYYYKKAADKNPINAISKAMLRVRGSYAFGIMFHDYPNTLYAARKDSPLIIGKAKDATMIASDVTPVMNKTKTVYYIDNLELAELKADSVKFFNIDGEEIEKKPSEIKWDAKAAEKGGYEHFMMKEIQEQPKAVKDTINAYVKDGKIDLSALEIKDEDLKKLERIYIIACGSAYHVGVAAKYELEGLAGIPVEVDFASEFRYRNPILVKNSMVIIVSQSGETADSLAALRLTKEKGVPTLGVVNVVGSSIAREADHVMYTYAGPEIAVATTKAYSTQLIAFDILSTRIAELKGKIDAKKSAELIAELQTIPDKIKRILEDKERIQWFAAKFSNTKDAFFIGRGVDYAICLEGSLKMKEVSYIHSEAYAAGELKHGTISLIEDGTLVVGVLTQNALYEKTRSNMVEVKSRGAYLMGLANYGNYNIEDTADFVVYIPKTNEYFTPSLAVIPLQLMGYYVSVAKGLDVDKPRNLAKSVTVE